MKRMPTVRPVPVSHILAATLRLAAEHHDAGRLDEATDLYREVCAIDPWNADATFLLSVAARQSGQRGQGRRLLKRALALDPRRAIFRCEPQIRGTSNPDGISPGRA